ncbi:MAG: hypothetical protein LBQ47_00455 [Endomicrobium sp.]|jgi:hypothetical protein|nr:hypothetical protein [Endomicrobium sp.]
MKNVYAALFFIFITANCFALTPNEIIEKSYSVDLYGRESAVGAYVIEQENDNGDRKNDESRGIFVRYSDKGAIRTDAYAIDKKGQLSGTSFIKNKDGAFFSKDPELTQDGVKFVTYTQLSKKRQEQNDELKSVSQKDEELLAQKYRQALQDSAPDIEVDDSAPDVYVLTFKNKDANKASEGFTGDGKLYVSEAVGRAYLLETKRIIDKKTFFTTGYEIKYNRDAVKISVENSDEYKQLSDKKKAAYLEKKTDEIVKSFSSKTTLSDFRSVPKSAYSYPYSVVTETTNSKNKKDILRIKIIKFEKLTAAAATDALTPKNVKSMKAAVRDEIRASRGKAAVDDNGEEVTNEDIKQEVKEAVKDDIKRDIKRQAKKDIMNSVRKGAFGF